MSRMDRRRHVVRVHTPLIVVDVALRTECGQVQVLAQRATSKEIHKARALWLDTRLERLRQVVGIAKRRTLTDFAVVSLRVVEIRGYNANPLYL